MNLYEKYLPDVILMDINMPRKNGVEATGELIDEYPDAKSSCYQFMTMNHM